MYMLESDRFNKLIIKIVTYSSLYLYSHTNYMLSVGSDVSISANNSTNLMRESILQCRAAPNHYFQYQSADYFPD